MTYWKTLNPDGTTETVGSYSTDAPLTDRDEITKAEYDAFIASLPEPEPEPPSPDYLRACELLAQSPPVITMPDVWELLRIIGRRLGYRFEE